MQLYGKYEIYIPFLERKMVVLSSSEWVGTEVLQAQFEQMIKLCDEREKFQGKLRNIREVQEEATKQLQAKGREITQMKDIRQAEEALMQQKMKVEQLKKLLSQLQCEKEKYAKAKATSSEEQERAQSRSNRLKQAPAVELVRNGRTRNPMTDKLRAAKHIRRRQQEQAAAWRLRVAAQAAARKLLWNGRKHFTKKVWLPISGIISRGGIERKRYLDGNSGSEERPQTRNCRLCFMAGVERRRMRKQLSTQKQRHQRELQLQNSLGGCYSVRRRRR